MNQAALKAVIDGQETVTMSHLEFSRDKIMMGKQFLSDPSFVLINGETTHVRQNFLCAADLPLQ